MSPLSKDETRRDSSLALTIGHYTVIKTMFMYFCVWFSWPWRSVLPLIKSGPKAVWKQVLRSGIGFASDVFARKNAKQATIERAKSAGIKLLNQAVGSKKRKRQKWRKKNSIFDKI